MITAKNEDKSTCTGTDLVGVYEGFTDRGGQASVDARAMSNKDALIAALTKLKVESVTTSYDGCGDSGQVHDAVFAFEKKDKKDVANETVEITTSTSSFKDGAFVSTEEVKILPVPEAVHEVLYDWLVANHPGWENNDGAEGEMVILVKENRIEFIHTQYHMSSETYGGSI